MRVLDCFYYIGTRHRFPLVLHHNQQLDLQHSRKRVANNLFDNLLVLENNKFGVTCSPKQVFWIKVYGLLHNILFRSGSTYWMACTWQRLVFLSIKQL